MTTVPLCKGGCGKDVRQNQDGTWRTYCRACNGRINGKANEAHLRAGALKYREELIKQHYSRIYEVLCLVERHKVTVDAALDLLVQQQRSAYQRGYGAARVKYKSREAA